MSEIAIIGAGIAGLALALSLHEQGITAKVYESRDAPLNIGGSIMLSPNGLRVLDALGLYGEVSNKGWNFEMSDFRNPDGSVIDFYEFGSKEKYGYPANRIYRFELIDTLLDKIKAEGIEVNYGRKFSHVVSENDSAVMWQWTDGTTSTAGALIGADGIHSSVRKYLYPDLTPKYLGQAAVTAAVPHSNLGSNPIGRVVTIVAQQSGAFVMAPQRKDGSELIVGKQRRISPEPTRKEWDTIQADKAAAIAFLQEGNEVFGTLAVDAVKNLDPNRNLINVWPFYRVPKLERWTSQKRRVALVGDSAHAIPPSAGQGINQAFEDVYMLALLLRASRDDQIGIQMQDALTFWQQYRQSRVDQVLVLNGRVDERRLPQQKLDKALDQNAEQAPLTVQQTKVDWDLSWLYEPDFKGIVDAWVAAKRKQA